MCSSHDSESAIQDCVTCQCLRFLFIGCGGDILIQFHQGTHDWFSWVLGCEGGSVHTGLLYEVAPAPDSGHRSSDSSVFSYSQGISISLWSWSREPDWSTVLPRVELDSLFSHRSRNPECLCLLWTDGPEARSCRPLFNLFSFYFSSTEMFAVGLWAAMCF